MNLDANTFRGVAEATGELNDLRLTSKKEKKMNEKLIKVKGIESYIKMLTQEELNT